MSSFSLPASLSIPAVLRTSPPPLEFVLPGFLRATVGSLVSPGGVGKSFWALALAMEMGAEGEISLTGLSPSKGRVVLFAREDPELILKARIHAVGGLNPAGRYSNLDVRCCVGTPMDILNAECLDEMVSISNGASLVVLDTLSRFHSRDENSSQDMTEVMGGLEVLAKRTGASVLFLHHTNKASVSNGMQGAQQAARGSSVLIDNARWSAFMAVMSEQEAGRYGVPLTERLLYVRWNISKQNYGAPLPDRWYRRGVGGALIPVELTRVSSKGRASQQAQRISSAFQEGAQMAELPQESGGSKFKDW